MSAYNFVFTAVLSVAVHEAFAKHVRIAGLSFSESKTKYLTLK